MGLASAVKAKVLRKLQDTNQDNYDNDELQDYCNECLQMLSQELANRRRRIAQKDDTTSFAFTSGTQNADLPSDFLVMETVFHNGDNEQLTRASDAQVKDWEASTSTGKPSHWWIEDADLYVHPIPDASYTLKAVYYPVESISDITADSLPWSGLFDEAVKWFMLAECYHRSELYGASAHAMDRYEKERENVLARLDQREPLEVGMDIESEADHVAGSEYFAVSDPY